MSEKIYAWLLRLYPSSFQQSYGEEALRLFRDRARDERGGLSSLRLWLDLLMDLAMSLPRCYRSFPSALVVSGVKRSSACAPSFHSLEDEAFRSGSLLYGGIASFVFYGAVLLLLAHPGSRYSSYAFRNFEQTPSDSVAIAAPRSPVVRNPTPDNLVHASTVRANVRGVQDVH